MEAKHFLETLLEVVRQEAVEDGVGAGVYVGEDDQDEVDCGGDVVLGYCINQVDDVGGKERQPTQDKHQHDDHHHASHLTLRLAALC